MSATSFERGGFARQFDKDMKRYRLLYRGCRNTFFDTDTNRRESLGTNNRDEAQRLVDVRNEAARHVGMNLQIAQVYLQRSDPSLATRTWQDVLEKIVLTKNAGPSQDRWKSAIKDKAFDLIRYRKLVETTSEHFLNVLHAGNMSTNPENRS